MTTTDAAQVWKAVLGELQMQVTRPSYETWLKNTVGIACNGDEFVVGAPSTFVAEMLEQRMYSLISEAVERITNDPVEVRFEVAGGAEPTSDQATSEDDKIDLNDGMPLMQQPAQGARPRPVELNPKYTFETFIVGKSNELAHAAAVAVSNKPGTVYNPLVMYSGVGLGKTHLLHAIGHRILAQGKTLIYATTEQFTNEYIKAIREGTTDEFRDRYRSADLLLLDDIQFLIGKEQTQEGFFHTFNALHMTSRQIVITSDRPVTTLTLLEDRIRSRLSGGLVADISPPDLETRLAILRAKSETMGINIEPEILGHIGERVYKNIRELEGTLNRVIAYADLTGSEITPELIKRATAELNDSGPARRSTEAEVLDAVSNHYGVDREAIKGTKRDKKTAQARQVTMYLMREESDMSATAIGRALGGKDHTTVLHGCRTIENKLNVEPNLRRDVVTIREALQGG